MMEHKGYLGKVEFDDLASVFHGEVVNTSDVITFQGTSVAELKRAFQDSVNDYLAFCAERGESPNRPFSGRFVTRISPDLHRQVTIAADRSGQSLNAWVADRLQKAVDKVGETRNLSRSKIGQKKAASKGLRRPPSPKRKLG